MSCINNCIFRKLSFGLGLGLYFILFPICLGSFVSKNLNKGLLEYNVEAEVSDDIYSIVPYHVLYKREAEIVLNSTTESSNETETSTISSPIEDENTSSESPTTDPSNSVYDPDSGDESDLQLKEINNTYLGRFDHHRYYRSYSKAGMENVIQYWVDLDNMPDEKVVSHDSLSSAYRRALTVSLSFDFPFYGHTLRNVTIATGGFLFTGAFLHKWLAATQYIAPLMANFDTSVSSDAMVKYSDNGTSLTVQWEKVVLQDNPSAGPFTFQVTIHESGHIVFAYKDIPVVVTLIEDMKHPVKVGLSDAYIMEKTIFYVRKKTIYEYHKINIKRGRQINNWTAIIFEPLKLCVSSSTCEDCLTADTSFKCEWCPMVGRCSDGLDRHRQDWLEGGCDISSIANYSYCAHLPSTVPTPTAGAGDGPVGAASLDSLATLEEKRGHSNLLLGLLMTAVVVVLVGGWAMYAYLHPHTASGQFFIKYRPSTWSWRRGEARYTAATMHSIHM